MADVTSLGVHTPAGLPYLINEGILPAEPKKELYQWDIYAFPGDNGMVEEEILATKDCVVWSQNGLVRTAYRFELEGEDVRQAVLTRFPKENGSLQTKAASSRFHGQIYRDVRQVCKEKHCSYAGYKCAKRAS